MDHVIDIDKPGEVGVSGAAHSPTATTQYQFRYGVDEFVCGVCQEVMLEPTTLQCGHSYCRHCLAKWFLSQQYQQCTCPVCRERYTGLPRVSIDLRAAIKSRLGEFYEERKRQVLNRQTEEDVAKFERILNQQTSSLIHPSDLLAARIQSLELTSILQNVQEQQRQRTALLQRVGVIAAAIIVCLPLLFGIFGVFSKRNVSDTTMLKWTPQEAREWLKDVGPWAEEALGQKFDELQIDGVLLRALTLKELDRMTDSLDSFHKRAFLLARNDTLRKSSEGYSWNNEGKDLFRIAWLVVYCHKYPRIAVLALWLFDYEDSLLPFIHVVYPVINMTNIRLSSYTFPSPTTEQWFSFISGVICFPYMVFADFLYKHTWETHTITTLFAIICLVLLTWVELLSIVVLLMQSKRKKAEIGMWEAVQLFFYCCMWHIAFYILWNFIPTFVVYIWIVFNLVGSAIDSLSKLWDISKKIKDQFAVTDQV